MPDLEMLNFSITYTLLDGVTTTVKYSTYMYEEMLELLKSDYEYYYKAGNPIIFCVITDKRIHQHV